MTIECKFAVYDDPQKRQQTHFRIVETDGKYEIQMYAADEHEWKDYAGASAWHSLSDVLRDIPFRSLFTPKEE